MATKEFEDESTWLRHRVLRLRTIPRYVKDPRAENGLREFIAEALFKMHPAGMPQHLVKH